MTHRSSSRTPFVIALCAVALCAAWAFAPLSETPTFAKPQAVAQASKDAPFAQPFNAAAFSRPIWPPPPEPAKAPPPPPPPPAAPELKAQLIAITGDGDGRCAIVYDPAADALRTIAVGDTVDHRTVTRITPHAVELTLPAPHHTTATLTLKPAAPASGGQP